MTPHEPQTVRALLSKLIEADPQHDATSLAKKIGRGGGYIRDFLNGRKDTLGAAETLKIERHYHLEPGGLIKGRSMEDLRRVPVGEEFDPDPEFTDNAEGMEIAARIQAGRLGPGEVPERNVIAGLGQGGQAEEIRVNGDVLDGVRDVWRVPVPYLHTELRAREGEVDFIAVDGDSMVPTLLPGDRVMINRSQKAPSPDGLYAIFDGIGISVKRLEIIKGSSPLKLRIISDNPHHKTDEIAVSDLHVVGRVICRVTRC